MKFLSALHILAAVLSLITAAVVLLAPKGTRLHRRTGYVFAVSLLLTNLSAAFLFNLTGRVNVLHGFIIISLFSLTTGMWAAIRRSSAQWIAIHIRGMTGAAVGVWAAGLVELTVLPRVWSANAIIGAAVGTGIVAFFAIWGLNYYFLKNYKI